MDVSILNNPLSNFDPISLDEMDSVKLFNRADTKFLFHEKQFNAVINKMIPFYRILEIERKRTNSYETLYFDTGDFRLYHHHLHGKANRYKIRYRRYIESDKIYLEIKQKTNKEKTVKSRTRQANISQILKEEVADFVFSKSGINPVSLLPMLQISFTRMTFVNIHQKERLTIDTNLTYIQGNNTKSLNGLIIAELKQENYSSNSDFIKVMKSEQVRSNQFSKYSIGIALMNKGIKQNRFKPRIRLLNKILYGTTTPQLHSA